MAHPSIQLPVDLSAAPQGYGYGSTGKKSWNRKFEEPRGVKMLEIVVLRIGWEDGGPPHLVMNKAMMSSC